MKTITHSTLVSLIVGVGILDKPEVSIEKIALTMEQYTAELELFNAAYDLVGSDDYDGIIRRHIMDSLTAVPALTELFNTIAQNRYNSDYSKISVADVGSGAGFPGIPLAVAFPTIQFTLIERMSKRCTFLENCIAMLQLKNVSVICSEVEKISPACYDVVTFRAFRPLDKTIITALLRITKQDGFLAAYKAKMQKIEEEMALIAGIAPSWRALSLNSDFLGKGEESRERNLVLINNK